jgi:GDPmannose 4,6-dehydratase
MRPAEVDVLRGNFNKAKEKLGWIPKTSFVDLVKKMVDNDLKILSK